MTLTLAALAAAALIGLASTPAIQADDAAKKAAIGEAAPDFTLPDSDGKAVHLADLKGKIIVLEWMNPSCPVWHGVYERKTLTTLAAKYKEKNVAWLAIDSTAKSHGNFSANEAWRKENKLPYPMLVDSDSVVGHLYDARTTPHVYVIDAAGKLVYSGAVDDDQRGNKSAAERTNFLADAIEETVAGKAVTKPTTKPYGCSVKYAP